MSNYDFGIGKQMLFLNCIIKVINNFDTTQAKNIIFSWTDTVEERKNKSAIIHIYSGFRKTNFQRSSKCIKGIFNCSCFME